MDKLEKTHAVIHLAIDSVDSETLPVLVEIDDKNNPKISYSVAKYVRHLQRQGESYDLLKKRVSILGKLRDYYFLVKGEEPLSPGKLAVLLDDFLLAYDLGEALDWKSVSNSQYATARITVADYAKFIMDLAGPIWTSSDYDFVQSCRTSYVSLARAQQSLLFHTKKRQSKKTRRKRRTVNGLRQFRPFPPSLVQELITETSNSRDRFIFALCAYAGRRGSEFIHTFADDFGRNGNDLHVWLRHPSNSNMKWLNRAHRQVSGQRREYLKSMFQLLPRTEHGKKPTACGWKGMKFDDEAALESECYWIRDAGRYLMTLYKEYLYGSRALVPKQNHPYFFVDSDGKPWTMKSLRQQFMLARKRLEKKKGISLAGYGIHSLRHFYGFYCTDVLRLDILMTQKYMGHVSVTSTAIYTHASPATAQKVMKEAERKAKGNMETEAMTLEQRNKIYEDFSMAPFPPLPYEKELAPSFNGHINPSTLSRRIL